MLSGLEHKSRVSYSNAKLCELGLIKRRNNEKREEVLSTEYLCNKESKSIKIELSPAKRMNWYNLKPEQKLILQAARNNNVDYIK